MLGHREEGMETERKGKSKRVETHSLACVQERMKAQEEEICTRHDAAISLLLP